CVRDSDRIFCRVRIDLDHGASRPHVNTDGPVDADAALVHQGSQPPPSARNTFTRASAIAASEAATAVSAEARLASTVSTSSTRVRRNRNRVRAWLVALAALSRACVSS